MHSASNRSLSASIFLGASPPTSTPARKPSAISTRQIASRRRECGSVSSLYRARIALRIRVSNSAIGSVCDIIDSLPARLDDARQLAVERIFAQAHPAHLETPIVRARAAAQRAAIVRAHFEFWFAGCLNPQARFRHSDNPYAPCSGVGGGVAAAATAALAAA